MISQSWIKSEEDHLAILESQKIKPRFGVILLSGFGQSMCDSDYFMSRIARRLHDLEFLTVQADLSGHGDSTGQLETISLDKLISNIVSVIKMCKETGIDSWYGVGRGLSATLLASVANTFDIKGIVGINPYCLGKEEIINLWGSTLKENEHSVNLRKVLSGGPELEEKIAFFGALGSDIENLLGQHLSCELLSNLIHYDALDAINRFKGNSMYLIPEGDKVAGFESSQWNCSLGERKLDTRRKISFPIDAIWRHKTIELIVDWFSDHIKNIE